MKYKNEYIKWNVQYKTTKMLFLLPFLLIVTIPHVSKQANPEFNYTLDPGYPIGNKLFGNIAGVDVDPSNNVVIFHRGSHKWNVSTFDANDVYRLSQDKPIMDETVVTIDPRERKVIRAWGIGKFFMPHGLSLDREGKNVWLTDCALHQVFKYSIDGTQELIVLGVAFTPGNDESHFCKPTSVADTGEFVFVADGYCNSRIVMLSAQGKYIGEFGQSADNYLPSATNSQPTFYIPHKIVYAQEAKMLCVADRENGRIQCFSLEPERRESSQEETGLLLNGAIRHKFTIADPLFNGRLFSLDYSPIQGGIIMAVSGESLYSSNKPPLGFVYNVTTGLLISRFAPPPGRTFGMAHDLAVTGGEAESLYVVDVSPVNLWKFSRPIKRDLFRAADFSRIAGHSINNAISIIREKEHAYGYLWYLFLVTVALAIFALARKTRKSDRYTPSESLAPLYNNSYSTSINSLFGHNRPTRRFATGRSNHFFSSTFSRRAFLSMFSRNQEQQSDFSRIPLDDSDNSDEDDKSDSDVEEFNINQATSIKVSV